MNTVVVSDTNIFIDLIESNLLESFMDLPWEIHTTDFVINELNKGIQRNKVERFISSGEITVKSFTGKEMEELFDFSIKQRARTRVSIQDCSVWLYAQKNTYTLLTGDNRLRHAASENGVDVHGIFYIIDKMVETSTICRINAIEALEKLKEINPRLPLSYINEYINKWKE